jgi:hypothetical protein
MEKELTKASMNKKRKSNQPLKSKSHVSAAAVAGSVEADGELCLGQEELKRATKWYS